MLCGRLPTKSWWLSGKRVVGRRPLLLSVSPSSRLTLTRSPVRSRGGLQSAGLQSVVVQQHGSTTHATRQTTLHSTTKTWSGTQAWEWQMNKNIKRTGSVLLNDALNTFFYLWLYGVGHMVKDHSDSEKGNPLPPHGLLFPINSSVFYYTPSNRQVAHTTAFVTPVVEHWLEQEIAQWNHHMKDRSDDPSHHEQTLLTRSYISLPKAWEWQMKKKMHQKNKNQIKILCLCVKYKVRTDKRVCCCECHVLK